jgi:hypothetical protein
MSSTADSFAQTADALSSTLAAHGTLLESNAAQFRNYLLDSCGSDRRPLVDVLLAVGPFVQTRLGAQQSREPWETRRAPLVHQLVATRYLQPDIARWLVDAWGAALGVAPRVIAQPALVRTDASHLTADAAPLGGRGTVNVPPPPVAKVVAPRAPLPPPSRPTRQTRSAGARLPASIVANTTAGTARPVAPRWRTLSPALNRSQLVQLQRIERVSLGLIALAAVGVFVAAIFALRGRKADTVVAAAVMPVIAPGSAADSAAQAARGPMHTLPASLPPMPPGPPAPPGSTQAPTATTVSGGTARDPRTSDSLASDTLFHSATSRLLPPVAHAVSGAMIISAGVAGRYRVEQHVRSVDGSPSCADVAAALANGRTSIEVVTHTPGAFSFAMPTRGVTGVLDADAYFESGPRSGTTDGVTWRFRMRGQFTATGFVGESWTTTDATIKWGRTQSCITVADLVAERIAP